VAFVWGACADTAKTEAYVVRGSFTISPRSSLAGDGLTPLAPVPEASKDDAEAWKIPCICWTEMRRVSGLRSSDAKPVTSLGVT